MPFIRTLFVAALFVSPLLSLAAFTQDLKVGDTHPEVKQLQQFLNKEGYAVTKAGEETELFGTATQEALIKYQTDHARNIIGDIGILNDLGTLNVLTRNT